MTPENCKGNGFELDLLGRSLGLAALACAVATPFAKAQNTPAPKCAIAPAPPAGAARLGGFPAERIYIHPKHPELCVDPSDRSCDATAYVIVGDSVKTTDDCSGWTFVEFDGKKKTTGWVASRRLFDNPGPQQGESADPLPPSTQAACQIAERLMNAALREPPRPGQRVLPSALENSKREDELPAALNPDDDGQTTSGTMSDAHIQGHTFKAVSVSSRGTCSADYLELWDPALRNRMTIPSSNADSENFDGDSHEDLVKLNGQPYFAHFDRTGEVSLSAFDKSLTAHPICRVVRSALRLEVLRSASEPELCAAVRTKSVSGAPIQDIEPYDLTLESFWFAADRLEALKWTHSRLRVVARGRLDVDNDGQPDDVGLLEFENGVGSAGCGHDVETVVPIKLNSDGTPDRVSSFNLKMIEFAGAGEDGRLLMFRGRVYFETKSHMDVYGGGQHVVWELSASGPKNVCEFLPVRYKAVDDISAN